MELKNEPLAKILTYGVLGLAAFIMLFPLVLMVVSSLRSNFELFLNPLGLPETVDLGIYVRAWQTGGLGRAMWNSILISALTVLSVCTVTSMAAWVIARRSCPGWLLMSLYFLASTTIPIQMFIFPLYFLFAQFGLTNQPLAIVVIYTAIYTPFSLFLLRIYVLEIPVELEEAARIDGASEWAIFRRVILPLLTPGLITVALITGLNTWNEFLIAMTFLQDGQAATATARFSQLSARFSSDVPQQMATATIIALPTVIFFILLQRRFIDGIASGAVKG